MIVSCCVFAALITAIILAIVLSAEKPVRLPQVQGSHVTEMDYEAFDEEYKVEKYTDYKSFSKSVWADYEFVSGKKATQERYSREYFEKSDLAIVKFNKPQSGIKYYVTDAAFTEDACRVELVGTKRLAAIRDKTATYCCFLETENDVENCSFALTIKEEIEHESQSFSYITMENEHYLFPDKTEPEIFRIEAKEGLHQFVENDPVLTEQSYSMLFLSQYKEEFYRDHSLLLVRLPASDFESWVVCKNGNAMRLVGFRSNHYLYPTETKFHILLAIAVDKEFDAQTLTIVVLLLVYCIFFISFILGGIRDKTEYINALEACGLQRRDLSFSLIAELALIFTLPFFLAVVLSFFAARGLLQVTAGLISASLPFVWDWNILFWIFGLYGGVIVMDAILVFLCVYVFYAKENI